MHVQLQQLLNSVLNQRHSFQIFVKKFDNPIFQLFILILDERIPFIKPKIGTKCCEYNTCNFNALNLAEKGQKGRHLELYSKN